LSLSRRKKKRIQTMFESERREKWASIFVMLVTCVSLFVYVNRCWQQQKRRAFNNLWPSYVFVCLDSQYNNR
jgi:hypothetical protein